MLQAPSEDDDADMIIIIVKTEVMQVCEQGQIPAATVDEVKDTCNFN